VVALWGVSGREFHKNLWGISRQPPCPNQRNASRSTSSFRRDNCSRIPQCSYSNIKVRRDMLWRIRPAWLFLPTIAPQHASNLRRIHYAPISQSFKIAQVPAQIPPFPALLLLKNRKGRA
jgi:hypothetical protein